MSWLFLAITVASDVAGTAALERSTRGHSRRYLALSVPCYLVALIAFARALQTIPTSAADAVPEPSHAQDGRPITAPKAIALLAILAGASMLNTQGTKPALAPPLGGEVYVSTCSTRAAR